MKWFSAVVFVFFISLFFGQSKISVVIDAGHGGSDPGNLSDDKTLLQEKDLNLKIAKFVGKYLEQNLQNVQIIFTRADDSFVSLDDRVAKANTVSATYFISIHCNANSKQHVHGTETHIHNYESKKAVKLAHEIEHQFAGRAGRHSRGVKDTDDREHSLQVLKYTSMTSVLVECGFMTNEKEAKYLNTTYGQEILASAIYRGFKSFIQAEHPTINFTKTTQKATIIAKSTSPKTTTTPVKTTTPNTSTISTTKTPLVQTLTIQLMSSREPLNVKNAPFIGLGMVVTRVELPNSKVYKYIYKAGTFTTKEEAELVLEKVKKKGFTDAILIPK